MALRERSWSSMPHCSGEMPRTTRHTMSIGRPVIDYDKRCKDTAVAYHECGAGLSGRYKDPSLGAGVSQHE